MGASVYSMSATKGYTSHSQVFSTVGGFLVMMVGGGRGWVMSSRSKILFLSGSIYLIIREDMHRTTKVFFHPFLCPAYCPLMKQ